MLREVRYIYVNINISSCIWILCLRNQAGVHLALACFCLCRLLSLVNERERESERERGRERVRERERERERETEKERTTRISKKRGDAGARHEVIQRQYFELFYWLKRSFSLTRMIVFFFFLNDWIKAKWNQCHLLLTRQCICGLHVYSLWPILWQCWPHAFWSSVQLTSVCSQ